MDHHGIGGEEGGGREGGVRDDVGHHLIQVETAAATAHFQEVLHLEGGAVSHDQHVTSSSSTSSTLHALFRPDLLDVLLLEPDGSNCSAFGEKIKLIT